MFFFCIFEFSFLGIRVFRFYIGELFVGKNQIKCGTEIDLFYLMYFVVVSVVDSSTSKIQKSSGKRDKKKKN